MIADKISTNAASTTNRQIQINEHLEKNDWNKPQQKQTFERLMYEKLNYLNNGPQYDLAQVKFAEKKFSNRSRLYVGNISAKLTEQDLNDLFRKYGETSDLFFNKEKNFAFVKLDYRRNAESARDELNGKFIKGKPLKVRFAPNGSLLKVKNLDDCVTNELLYAAFSIFGVIERCIVIPDDKGKSIGEGLVEYEKKSCAKFAYQKCNNELFFLTSNPRPVIVEFYSPTDLVEGYNEKDIYNKNNQEYLKSRSKGPRFAKANTFEYESGLLWKQLYDLQRQKEDTLEAEFELNRNKLKKQIEIARYENETAALREELRSREQQIERQKRNWELRHQQFENDRKRKQEEMYERENNYRGYILREYELNRSQKKSLNEGGYYLDYTLNVEELNYNCYVKNETRQNFENVSSKRKKRL